MRFSPCILAYFFNYNNLCKIHPITHYNRDIYHYDVKYDWYRYGSKNRKLYKKQKNYINFVQDHHIIPKQWKNHPVVRDINYDINSSNNLMIMPIPQAVFSLNINPNLRTHYKGHSKYNIYVKNILDNIDKMGSLDDKKYCFWLFYHFVIPELKTTSGSIDLPWT